LLGLDQRNSKNCSRKNYGIESIIPVWYGPRNIFRWLNRLIEREKLQCVRGWLCGLAAQMQLSTRVAMLV